MPEIIIRIPSKDQIVKKFRSGWDRFTYVPPEDPRRVEARPKGYYLTPMDANTYSVESFRENYSTFSALELNLMKRVFAEIEAAGQEVIDIKEVGGERVNRLYYVTKAKIDIRPADSAEIIRPYTDSEEIARDRGCWMQQITPKIFFVEGYNPYNGIKWANVLDKEIVQNVESELGRKNYNLGKLVEWEHLYSVGREGPTGGHKVRYRGPYSAFVFTEPKSARQSVPKFELASLPLKENETQLMARSLDLIRNRNQEVFSQLENQVFRFVQFVGQSIFGAEIVAVAMDRMGQIPEAVLLGQVFSRAVSDYPEKFKEFKQALQIQNNEALTDLNRDLEAAHVRYSNNPNDKFLRAAHMSILEYLK